MRKARYLLGLISLLILVMHGKSYSSIIDKIMTSKLNSNKVSWCDISTLINLGNNLSVKTCGMPKILSQQQNITAYEGDRVTFHCKTNNSCIIPYHEWYHIFENGTEKLLQVRKELKIYEIFVLLYVIGLDLDRWKFLRAHVLPHHRLSADIRCWAIFLSGCKRTWTIQYNTQPYSGETNLIQHISLSCKSID